MSREESLALVRRLHEGGRPMREALLDVAADDLVWESLVHPSCSPWPAPGTDAMASGARPSSCASGRPFSTESARVFTVRDGKVVRVRTYADTARYLIALYGPPRT